MSDGNYHCYINDLACRRAPAVAEAEGLIASECYDEAEKAVIAADSSIYGAVEIAKMYRRRLEHLLAEGIEGRADREHAEAVFHRAARWARSAFPEPHTAAEAEQYRDAADHAVAELVRLFGYEPEPAA